MRHTLHRGLAAALLFLFVGLVPAAQAQIYVDASATGANNGTSWTNAYTTLSAALAVDVSGSQIWVADGRYTPGNSAISTFTIDAGVTVYGGFRGTETSVAQRPANFLAVAATILDGDYDNNTTSAIGDATATYDVVTFAGNGILDGVIVEGGNDPRALAVVGPAGFAGGILVNGPTASGSTIRNAAVRNNDATQTGSIGGFNAGYALVNVLISDTGFGPTPGDVVAAAGARSDLVSDPSITYQIAFDNVTIAGNGGQVYAETEGNSLFRLTAENSIFFGNLTSLPVGSLQIQGTDAILTNVIFDGQNQCAASLGTCTNVVATNPNLRTTDGFFSLQTGSVALDYGNTALVPAGLTIDGAGRARIQGAAVDAGAFEGTQAVEITPPSPEISVSPSPVAFGNVFVGQSAQQTVTIANSGDAALNVSATTIGGTGFTIVSGGGAGAIAPGASRSVVLAFAATAVGPAAGTFTVASNDADEASVVVALGGTGVAVPTVPPITLVLSDDNVALGQEVTVDVVVGSTVTPATLFGLGAQIAFDATRFEFAGVDPGAYIAAPQLIEFERVQGGVVSFSYTRRRGVSVDASGTGIVARLRFRLNPDARGASPPTTVLTSNFTISDISAFNAASAFVPLQLVGDTDGDGDSDFPVGIDNPGNDFRVWPGDTDNNGIVATTDLFPIGSCYALTGPSRSTSEPTFQAPRDIRFFGQRALPFVIPTPGPTEPCTIAVTPNPAYADADGNGEIDQNDVIAIGVNFGRTHTLNKTEPAAGEVVATTEDTATEATTAEATEAAKTAGPAIDVATIAVRPVGSEVRLDVVVPAGADVERLWGSTSMISLPQGLFEIRSVAAGALIENGDLLAFESNDVEAGIFEQAYSRKRGAVGADGAGILVSYVLTVIAPMEAAATVSLSDVALSILGEGFTLAGAGEVELLVDGKSGDEAAEFSLEAFPNPVANAATVRYGLAEATEVSIRVYDMLGRQVGQLASGRQDAGTYTVRLDAGALATGSYVVRMNAGTFSEALRLQVVR